MGIRQCKPGGPFAVDGMRAVLTENEHRGAFKWAKHRKLLSLLGIFLYSQRYSFVGEGYGNLNNDIREGRF